MKLWMLALLGAAASALITSVAGAGPLKGSLAAFEPFIGTWEVTAKWSSGEPMWARTRYEPCLDGHFLAARTLVGEQNGSVYERYRSMIGTDSERGVFPVHTFAFTGDRSTVNLVPDGDGRFVSEWHSDETLFKERLALTGDDRIEWKVWAIQANDEDWELVLDAEWKKVSDDAPMAAPRLPLLDAVSPLRPLLGAWEVNTTWPDGVPLWSLTKVDAAPGGAYLTTTTLARDGDAQPYERYRAFIIKRPDANGFEEVSFTHKGTVFVAPATMTTEPSPVFESTIPAGPNTALEIVKRYEFKGDDSFLWTVQARQPGSEAWTPLAEGVWRRVSPAEGAPLRSIDPSLFVASGPDVRSFTRETTINASPEAVFKAWSTKSGWEEAYAKGSPSTAANIDLAVGGRYEWLFGGVLGSNGCQVLSYIPNRMISFTWNAPPTQALSRAKRTWVVVELEPEGDGTRVTLTHLGFGEGAQWDESYDYFGKAWEFVLGRMKESLEAEGK